MQLQSPRSNFLHKGIYEMKRLSDERLRQLVKVATLYYKEGKTQQEISRELKFSRPNISRMLEQAVARGIVTIQIHDPFSKQEQFNNWFKTTFGLMSVSLIDADKNDNYAISQRIAEALHDELESNIKDNSSIGIMAGLTINSISRYMKPIKQSGLTFVPLTGGFGNHADWQANLNARNFGEHMHHQYVQLNAPYIVKSKAAHDVLVEEPDIRNVLNKADSISAAIVGIGQMQRNATLINTGLLNSRQLAELHDKGAVGSICTSFFDSQGTIIDYSFSDHIIGMELKQLKKVPRVIAVVSGNHKVQAITGALLGKWIDVLITDIHTARSIQDYYFNHIFHGAQP